MKIGGYNINEEQLLIYVGIAALYFIFGPKLTKAIADKADTESAQNLGNAIDGMKQRYRSMTHDE